MPQMCLFPVAQSSVDRRPGHALGRPASSQFPDLGRSRLRQWQQEGAAMLGVIAPQKPASAFSTPSIFGQQHVPRQCKHASQLSPVRRVRRSASLPRDAPPPPPPCRCHQRDRWDTTIRAPARTSRDTYHDHCSLMRAEISHSPLPLQRLHTAVTFASGYYGNAPGKPAGKGAYGAGVPSPPQQVIKSLPLLHCPPAPELPCAARDAASCEPNVEMLRPVRCWTF